MSMLLDFIGGVAGDFKRQIDDKEKRRLDYIERKREIAERERLRAIERKERRADIEDERKYREGLAANEEVETFVQDGNLMKRTADNRISLVRALTKDELSDADLKRREAEARIAAMNRPRGGGSADSSSRTYEVDKDDALGILGLVSEEELDDAPPEVRDMYLNLKGRRLTDEQKNELRARFNATRRRDASARKGAIVFDTGGGENLEDMQVGGLINQLFKGR